MKPPSPPPLPRLQQNQPVPCISKRPVFVFQEEMNRGKPNWEHLSEDLHVLITVEDTHNRAKIKLQRAINEVKKLLVPAVSTSAPPGPVPGPFPGPPPAPSPSPSQAQALARSTSGPRPMLEPVGGALCWYAGEGEGAGRARKCVFVSFCVSVCDSLCMREYV